MIMYKMIIIYKNTQKRISVLGNPLGNSGPNLKGAGTAVARGRERCTEGASCGGGEAVAVRGRGRSPSLVWAIDLD